MTAVLERDEVGTRAPCDACKGIPDPAEWKYIGDRARQSYLCDHCCALFKAGVDTRPSSYVRLGP